MGRFGFAGAPFVQRRLNQTRPIAATMATHRILYALAPAILLAACNEAPEERRADARDPLMTEAIEGQIMVDSDLSQQNARNMAVMPGGPADPARPLPDAAPDITRN